MVKVWAIELKLNRELRERMTYCSDRLPSTVTNCHIANLSIEKEPVTSDKVD